MGCRESNEHLREAARHITTMRGPRPVHEDVMASGIKTGTEMYKRFYHRKE